MTECPICALPYNKTNNCIVRCSNAECNFDACKECTRRYIMESTSDPHCMNCKKGYDQEFITKNLNQTWVKKQYRQHRKYLLLEREKAQIPTTMPMVELYTTTQKLKKRDLEYKEQISELKKQLRELQNEHRVVTNQIFQIENGNYKIDTKKEFIMPCVAANCNGFLSSSYKCAVCKLYTCPKCHELIGETKNEHHVCDEDKVKSVEFIKKESKPCPSCGTRISKLSGCDQMWCPECKKAFSWRTGQIETGVIHNPHFHEWNRLNGGMHNRNPGDLVCGGMPNIWNNKNFAYLRNLVRANGEKIEGPDLLVRRHEFENYSKQELASILKIRDNISKHISIISLIQRDLYHVNYYTLPRLRTEVRRIQDNDKLRIKFILKEISETEFSNEIMKNDLKRKKSSELLHIWELISAITIDIYRDLISTLGNDWIPTSELVNYSDKIENISTLEKIVMKCFNRLESLFNYCNHQFEIIAATFGTKAPMIRDINEMQYHENIFQYSQSGKVKIFKQETPALNI